MQRSVYHDPNEDTPEVNADAPQQFDRYVLNASFARPGLMIVIEPRQPRFIGISARIMWDGHKGQLRR